MFFKNDYFADLKRELVNYILQICLSDSVCGVQIIYS